VSKLRAATLKKIERTLDDSYFAIDSFNIENHEDQSPFIVITFLPHASFTYEVSESRFGKKEYNSVESPGAHMATSEKYVYDDFDGVLSSIRVWARRIEEDFRSRASSNEELNNFVDSLKQKINEVPDDSSYFSNEEAEELKNKLSELENIILEQANKLEDSEKQIKIFKKELNSIKEDVLKFPKGVWYKVSGNKLIRVVKGFVASNEGREIIFKSVKKMLDLQ